MKRRRFMRVLLAGGALATIAACDSMPASAVAPWNGPDPAERDPRLRALAWALLAPNPHNLQSWFADLREPGRVRLHVDLDRLLPQTDPPNRQVLIGCGAFTELLRLAALQEGWRAGIEWLPEGDYGAQGVDARPFAEIRFDAAPEATPDPLFEAVRRRRTNRRRYADRVPPDSALRALAEAANRPGIRLQSTTEPQRVARIREFAIAGCAIEFGDPHTWGESAAVLHVGAPSVAADPSGLPVLGSAVWIARRLGWLDPEVLRRTDGLAATRALTDATEAARATPAWIWLASADNARRTQLECGCAYLRAALAATRQGLAMQPDSQVLQEFEAMRPLYRRFHEEAGVAAPARVQMLARLGYAEAPGPAPRRALANILARPVVPLG